MSGGDPTRRPARRGHARPAAPTRFEEALARASVHARRAAAEAARATRALLDAAAIGATGVPAAGHEPLRRAARWLDRVAAGAGAGWPAALGAALDAEIGRWETRSRTDPEARAVLRAFLGLRELLWELGLRGPDAEHESAPEPPHRNARTAGPRGRADRPRGARRLERVPIDGGGPAG